MTPRVLENKADYAEMIARAVKAIGDERRRYKKEKRDLSKAAKKAKGKAGAPIKRKAVGIQDYIIRLALMDVDEKIDLSGRMALRLAQVVAYPAMEVTPTTKVAWHPSNSTGLLA